MLLELELRMQQGCPALPQAMQVAVEEPGDEQVVPLAVQKRLPQQS
jgi:hypothetical protein